MCNPGWFIAQRKAFPKLHSAVVCFRPDELEPDTRRAAAGVFTGPRKCRLPLSEMMTSCGQTAQWDSVLSARQQVMTPIWGLKKNLYKHTSEQTNLSVRYPDCVLAVRLLKAQSGRRANSRYTLNIQHFLIDFFWVFPASISSFNCLECLPTPSICRSFFISGVAGCVK